MKPSEIKIIFTETQQGQLMIECKLKLGSDKKLNSIAHEVSQVLAPCVNTKVQQLFTNSKQTH